MTRPLLRAAAAACILAAALPASAGPPDAAKLRLAGEEYDAGAMAFKNKDYEVAASHFEAADAAVPSPKTLRLAIRARTEAHQSSRAATLAALALARYPADAETTQLAKDTLHKAEPSLQKVSIACASPCVVAVGTRAVPGDASTRWVVYLDPGSATVSASFFGNVSTQQSVDAKAGAAIEIRLEPADPAGAAAAPSSAPAAAAHTSAAPAAPSSAEIPPPDVPPDAPTEKKGSGLSPVFFVVGVVATAAVGGITVWSGIDTKNNPGPDAVRAACAGKGTTCPEYQDGLAKETRTNVLIGATVGTGVLTGVIGAFFTNWGGSKSAAPAAARAAGAREGASLAPSFAVLPGGGALGAAGRF